MESNIRGFIYGHAVGSAVGLYHKFTNSAFEFPRAEGCRGYAANDWSSETDQFIVAIITENPADLPGRLIEWISNTQSPSARLYTSPYLLTILSDPDFATDPLGVAEKIWEASSRKYAGNHSYCRAAAAGLRARPADMAEIFSITDVDPLCVAAAQIQARLIHDILGGVEFLTDPDTYSDHLHNIVEDVDADLLPVCAAATQSLCDLQSRPTHVFKPLSCTIYTLQLIAEANERKRRLSFEKLIKKIVTAGGDADVNGAAVGCIFGAVMGVESLSWVEALPRRDTLRVVADRFVAPVVSNGPNPE